MKILVIGSVRSDSQAEQFQQACKELGAALARDGHSFVLGSDNPKTADRWIVLGANEVPGQKHVVDVYRINDAGLKPFEHEHTGLRQIHFNWLASSRSYWPNGYVDAVKRSDAVIIVGGGKNTSVAAVAAGLLRKRLVSISGFGGTAKELFDEVGDRLKGAGLSENILADLNRPWDAQVIRGVLSVLRAELNQPSVELVADPGAISIGGWMKMLTVPQFVQVLVFLGALLTGAYGLGNWERGLEIKAGSSSTRSDAGGDVAKKAKDTGGNSSAVVTESSAHGNIVMATNTASTGPSPASGRSDVDADIVSIRALHLVRPLRDLENDMFLQAVPSGVYGFAPGYVVAWHAAFAELAIEQSSDDYEIHKLPNGEVHLIGYLSEPESLLLATTKEKVRLHLFRRKNELAGHVASVPANWIVTGNQRRFRDDYVLDLVLQPNGTEK